MNADTDCRKCKAPMTPLERHPETAGFFGGGNMTITAYACQKCGHWNNLKRRKKKPPPAE